MPNPSAFAIKICGLSTPETLRAALDAGADMIGLNFHPKSPRFVTLERAKELAAMARGRTEIVALIVDWDERQAAELVEALKPDWLQLHGRETPEHTAALRRAVTTPGLWERLRHGIPTMRTIDQDVAALIDLYRELRGGRRSNGRVH